MLQKYSTAWLMPGVLLLTAPGPAVAEAREQCAPEVAVPIGRTSLPVPDACTMAGVLLSYQGRGVEVPARGHFVGYATTGREGMPSLSMLARHLSDGRIEVDVTAAPSAPAAPAAPAAVTAEAAAADDACGDGYIVPWDGTSVTAPIPWTLSVVNPRGEVPAQFLSDDVVSNYWTAVRIGGDSLQQGNNDCGFLPGQFVNAAPVGAGGYSANQADISPSGDYCDSVTDALSTVQLASAGGNYAVTCHWGVLTPGPYVTREFDIQINEGFEFASNCVTLPSDVQYADLIGVMTHEWGHVYGLGHAPPGHPSLTMTGDAVFATPRLRTLGLGDYLGMYRAYGVPREDTCLPLQC